MSVAFQNISDCGWWCGENKSAKKMGHGVWGGCEMGRREGFMALDRLSGKVLFEKVIFK